MGFGAGWTEGKGQQEAARPQARSVPWEGRGEAVRLLPFPDTKPPPFLILELFSVNPVPLGAPQQTAMWLLKERAV